MARPQKAPLGPWPRPSGPPSTRSPARAASAPTALRGPRPCWRWPRADLSPRRRRPPASVGRRGGPTGRPLQYGRADGAGAAPGRWPARRCTTRPPATASCRSSGARGPGAGRHRHLVADHGAAGAPRGAGRAAPGEHQDHSVYPLGCWVYLAAESHVVPDRDGRTPGGRRDGHGHRRRRHPQKELIERAYALGEQGRVAVWCQDEAGPYQAIPQRSVLAARGAAHPRPHAYIRGGTAKLLTLFRPATGEVRAEPVATAPTPCSIPGSRRSWWRSWRPCPAADAAARGGHAGLLGGLAGRLARALHLAG